MAKRFKKCVLHIGTEKTGTTTIQNFLAANRGALLRDRVLYTKSAGASGSQRAFEACVYAKPWATDLAVEYGIKSDADRARFRERFLASFSAEAQKAKECDRLVVSCEHFHSRLKTIEEIKELESLLSAWVSEFQIVLYLRRQDRVAVSHYSTRLKSGQVRSGVFPGLGTGELFYYYNYEAVCQNWIDVFGVESLSARIFDRSRFVEGDLLTDFCATTGLPLGGKARPRNANESLNQAGVDFLRCFNQQVPRVIEGSINPVHRDMSALVSKLCRGKCAVANRADAQRFYDLYRPGNERLGAFLFPEARESLFDDDFSEYPEALGRTSPKYEDAVLIASEIWKELRGGEAQKRSAEELDVAKKQLMLARAEIKFLRGQIALKNGRDSVARQYLASALEINPAHLPAHLTLARLLLKTGEVDEGRSLLDKALALTPRMTSEIETLVDAYTMLSEKCNRGGVEDRGLESQGGAE